MFIFCLELSSISICIAKLHKGIRDTSRYKLLKACENPSTSYSQACCKLAKAWLAYPTLAFYKPAASCYEQVNFRLYCTLFTKKLSLIIAQEQKLLIPRTPNADPDIFTFFIRFTGFA